MKRIGIYCGSSLGHDPAIRQAAKELGLGLGQRQIGMVYGGARIGLMGEIAQAALEAGGEVIGVIPKFFPEAINHTALTRLHIVDTMHQRKQLMFDLADAFIAVPGGLGTMDEFFELLAWSQLQLHCKPCGLLNVNRYYDKLIAFLDHASETGFIHPDHLALIQVETDPGRMLDRLRACESR